MNLELLFIEFLRERRLLKNIAKTTENHYKQSWRAFVKHGGMDGDLNTGLLNRWVMTMREAGINPKSCNTRISAINAFMHWLYDNELIPRRIGAQLLKLDYPAPIPQGGSFIKLETKTLYYIFHRELVLLPEKF